MEWSSTPKSLLCLQARLPLHNRAASELGAFPYIKLEGIKLRMGSPPNLGCSDSRWKRPWRCIHSLTWLFTWGRWGSRHVYNLSSSCGCPQTWYIIIFSGYPQTFRLDCLGSGPLALPANETISQIYAGAASCIPHGVLWKPNVKDDSVPCILWNCFSWLCLGSLYEI